MNKRFSVYLNSKIKMLSMHAKDKHPDNMKLDNFKIAIVKETYIV